MVTVRICGSTRWYVSGKLTKNKKLKIAYLPAVLNSRGRREENSCGCFSYNLLEYGKPRPLLYWWGRRKVYYYLRSSTYSIIIQWLYYVLS